MNRKKISQELLDINSFLGYNKERIPSRMEVRSMVNTTDIEHLRFTPEGQRFDRKSAKIDAKALAIHIVAFANADGGTLVIGIKDNGDITGIDGYEKNINELLRAPFDYCVPSVTVETQMIDCSDKNGRPNHILLIQIFPSAQLHANQADEVSTALEINPKR